MANGLTTVMVCRDVLDAQVALGKLESEGIECSLANENLVGVAWTYSNAVGGVEVQVPVEQAAAALAALSRDESGLTAEIGEEMDPPQLPELCPNCGSEDLAVVRRQRYAAAAMLLVPLPLFFFGTRIKCRACGSEWKPPAA